jgi:hypothetical protein
MAQRTKRARGGELTPADLRGGPRVRAERRGGERIPCAREVSVLSARAPLGEGFRAVALLNCWAHGIGVVSDRPMQVGEQFVAKVRGESASLVAYTVRHCTPAGDGRHYHVGAALTAFIGPAGDSLALDALLPPRQTSTRPVRRAAANTTGRKATSRKRTP